MDRNGGARRAPRVGSRVSSMALAIGLAALAFPAQAQDAGKPSEPLNGGNASSTENQQDIVVTGSRIVRRDYSANTPITTVQNAALENTGSFALESKLVQLPQFSGSGNSQFATGYFNSGASTLNLRNLGENRNLVLLDGRRMQPATRDTLAVDINTIPSALISSVEVITGGASAVYGADAVAGVTNFKLKRDFSGVALDGYFGMTDRGDNRIVDLSATIGGNFADHRGNAVLALSYSDRGSVDNADVPFLKDGFRRGTLPSSSNFLGMGDYNPTQSINRPSQAALNAYFGQPQNGGAPAGAVSTTAILGFNSDGSLFNDQGAAIYNYRGSLYPRFAVDTTTTPGTATLKQNYLADTLASLPLKRWSAFGSSTYELTPDITAFGQLLYTHYDSVTIGGPPTAANSWHVDVPRDAAHPIPAAFAALLDSRPDPNGSWGLNKTLSFLGPGIVDHASDVYQGMVGLRGKIPGSDLTWEVYGSHGETQLTDHGRSGFASLTRYAQLIQAPNYGANFKNANGTCTSGINPFGEQTGVGVRPIGDTSLPQVSADCIQFVNPYWTNRTKIKQDIVEGTVQGKVLHLPAGEVRFAAGASYRKTSLRFDADKAFTPDQNYRSDLAGQFGVQSVSGSDAAREAYAELLVPLLDDLPFIKHLEVDLAYRYSNYVHAGATNTYKADISWQVVDALRLRGGYQRAARAPNVYEQFGPPTLVFDAATDACQANVTASYANIPSNPNRAKVQQLCRTLMGTGAPPILDPVNDPLGLNNYVGGGVTSISSYPRGNPNLKPEKADTFTVGAVFAPHWILPGDARINLSIDYYNITVKGAIGYIGADLSYQLCFNANGQSNPTYDPNNIYCKTIGRQQEVGTGAPSGVFSLYLNQGSIKTSGLDFQSDMRVQVGPGRVGLNGIVNYLDSFKRQVGPGAPTLDYAGYTGGYFRWKTYTTLSYSLRGAEIGLRWKYLSPAKTQDYIVTACKSTTCFADTPSYNLFDLYGNVRLNKIFTLRAGVDNLFDKNPPRVRGIYGNTDVQNYDILGRRYYGAISAKF